MAGRPYISVVIPAWNEERYIGKTLRSLRNQTIDPEEYEIIVVDGNSTDRTVQVARRFRGVKILHEDKGSIGFARNLGAKHARGEIVAFIDADSIAPRGWLMRIKKTFRKNLVAIGGMAVPLGGRWQDRALYFAANYGGKFLSWLGVYLFWGFNCAFRRDVFLRAGGFDASLKYLEDSELALRIGRYGKRKFSRRLKVMTSPRRFTQLGVLKSIWFALIGYFCVFTKLQFPWDYAHLIDKK